MSPTTHPKSWTKNTPPNETYLISTDPSLIPLEALSAAFASDFIYWSKPLTHSQLQTLIQNSLCLGLYHENELVGFARLITDQLTFAYLTDVYVLPAHQGKGLARFMMACLDEIVSEWDEHLRRLLLFTRDEEAAKLYKQTLGAQDVRETGTGKLICMERVGGGNTFKAPDH
ncbi:acyl-CoA N-acyltransferase, partial [Apiosordaria backusii]